MIEDELMKRANQYYEQFSEARKNGDSEKTLTAANEALNAVDMLRNDQGAILVGSVQELGEHARQLVVDETWLRTAETDIRRHLAAMLGG